mgnify:CR=1
MIKDCIFRKLNVYKIKMKAGNKASFQLIWDSLTSGSRSKEQSH